MSGLPGLEPVEASIAGSGGSGVSTNITAIGGTAVQSTSAAQGALPVEQIDPATGLPASILSTVPITAYPFGATAVQASSGNVAASVASATLPAVSAKTNYLASFDVTGTGATLGSAVTVTVTGILGGTKSYTFGVVAGALLPCPELARVFNPPLQGSGTNVAIVVSCPSLGTGNTNACANIEGFVV